jgi:hypothetical protein
MKSFLASILFIAVGLVMSSRPVFGHHSTAAYDMTKMTTVKGTVTGFQLVNPHAQIRFDVKDDKGNVEKWTAELNSAASLYRSGWTKNSVKVGAEIIATGNRSSNGTLTMHLRTVLLDNQELPIDR